MTTAIATRPPAGSLALPVTEPRMTPKLRSAVDGVLDPHPDLGGRIEPVQDHTRLEAEGVLRQYEAMCEPTIELQVAHWLMPINAVVRNPLPQADYARTERRMCLLLCELPASVFTARTQKQAMAAFAFWPAAADIHKLLYAEAMPLLRKRDALRKVIAAAMTPEQRPPASEEEKAVVSTMLAALREEMAARAAAREPETGMTVRAAYLTGPALQEARRRLAVDREGKR
jgi:hypothetical protein